MLVCCPSRLHWGCVPQEEISAVTKRIYVGNLSFRATEDQVRDLFSPYGEVEAVAMITDRETGKFRGFCFVEMGDAAADAAIKALNGTEVDGRALRINEAQPRENNRSGGPRGGGNFRDRDGGRRAPRGDRY